MPRPDRRTRSERRTAKAQRSALPELLPRPLASVGCRSCRAPDLRLHHRPGRRRPKQPLDGARRRQGQDAGALRRLHEGPHALCGPLLHGAHRFALLALRRRDHRQRLCGHQHDPDDPRGPPGARAHRARRQLCEGPALHGRARSEPPLHHALPRRALDHELRQRLRRQRPARQKVSCAAHRELPGAQRRLARRAHAHRRPHEPARRNALCRGGVPVGLRQDQPRDADPARDDAGLEGHDRGR